jgi:hypothetical protein
MLGTSGIEAGAEEILRGSLHRHDVTPNQSQQGPESPPLPTASLPLSLALFPRGPFARMRQPEYRWVFE